jgi:TPR repeat protein
MFDLLCAGCFVCVLHALKHLSFFNNATTYFSKRIPLGALFLCVLVFIIDFLEDIKMIDNKTSHYKYPLPNINNNLQDDVKRIEQSFAMIDAQQKELEAHKANLQWTDLDLTAPHFRDDTFYPVLMHQSLEDGVSQIEIQKHKIYDKRGARGSKSEGTLNCVFECFMGGWGSNRPFMALKSFRRQTWSTSQHLMANYQQHSHVGLAIFWLRGAYKYQIRNSLGALTLVPEGKEVWDRWQTVEKYGNLCVQVFSGDLLVKPDYRDQFYSKLSCTQNIQENLVQNSYFDLVNYMAFRDDVASHLEASKKYTSAADHLLDAYELSGFFGHDEANFFCGCRYLKGHETNYGLANRFFQKAANNGHLPSKFRLAESYYNGLGVAKNYQTAFSLFEEVSSYGYPPAQNYVGLCYQYGHGVEKNAEKALEAYHAAKDESSAAYYHLGLMYEEDDLVTKNIDHALQFYIESANRRYPQAKLKLAELYSSDQSGVPLNEEAALKFYKEASELGLTEADVELGGIFYKKSKETKDSKETIELQEKSFSHFEIAAKTNDTHANYMLGYFYYHGIGTMQNGYNAQKSLKLAASRQHPEALYSLGLYYENLVGGDKEENQKLWIDYYTQSAQLGHKEAQEKLKNF